MRFSAPLVVPRSTRVLAVAFLLTWCGERVEAQTPALPQTLAAAAMSSELWLGPWGPYARGNLGPCYQKDRFLSQSFTFPIVVGQRVFSISPQPGSDRKALHASDRIVFERRAMGLSQVGAGGDDRSMDAPDPGRNRMARLEEGDAGGLLWRIHVPFQPIAASDSSAPASGRTAGWGEGEATIEYFPAYAEPGSDGLLIRVTITNRSTVSETYYVDLLGGMNTVREEVFENKDLVVDAERGGEGVVVMHRRAPVAFALTSSSVRYPVRYYVVGDSYFSPGSATGRCNASGNPLPGGLVANSHAPATGTTGKDSGRWGLARVDEILLDPGETATVMLCVGVGSAPDAAHDSAAALLGLAEDATPFGKPREGLYTKAVAAHRTGRFSAGEASIDRLMAQSLANIPFTMLRRVGVPSRAAVGDAEPAAYEPEQGGLIALAWAYYRPDWSASQLNAWFLTWRIAQLQHPGAVAPTNLFALWELYQSTHDHDMLRRFYPAAARRYEDLLAAGRAKDKPGFYAWPDGTKRSVFAIGVPGERPTAAPAAAPRLDPDYCAYVIRSARIMGALAAENLASDADVRQFNADADAASAALNASGWDDARRSFQATTGGAASQAGAPETLAVLLPLICGPDVVQGDRSAALLKSLTEPARFWTDYGLRTAVSAAPGSSDDGIHIGLNWMIWKSLLDYGRPDLAASLARNLIAAYQSAARQADGCPAWIDSRTGAARGALDYSGEACALIPVFRAYHIPGTVSAGWDNQILNGQYDAAADSFHVLCKTRGHSHLETLLCATAHPNSRYTLSGTLKRDLVSDGDGVVTLGDLPDGVTLDLSVAPANLSGGSAR